MTPIWDAIDQAGWTTTLLVIAVAGFAPLLVSLCWPRVRAWYRRKMDEDRARCILQAPKTVDDILQFARGTGPGGFSIGIYEAREIRRRVEQAALEERMVRHLTDTYGTGFVMVTRRPDGSLERSVIDPRRIYLDGRRQA